MVIQSLFYNITDLYQRQVAEKFRKSTGRRNGDNRKRLAQGLEFARTDSWVVHFIISAFLPVYVC